MFSRWQIWYVALAKSPAFSCLNVPTGSVTLTQPALQSPHKNARSHNPGCGWQKHESPLTATRGAQCLLTHVSSIRLAFPPGPANAEPRELGIGAMEVVSRRLGTGISYSRAFLALKSITDTLSKPGLNEVTKVTAALWGHPRS